MNELVKRRKKFFEMTGASAALFKTSDSLQDSTVSYFSGLPKQFLANNLLVIKPTGKPLLIKSLLEPKISVPGVTVKNINKRKQLEGILKKELKGVKKIALNKPLHTSFSLRALKKLIGKKKLVDASKQLGKMRSVKSAIEIEKISKACKIAESVAESIEGIFTKGMTEKRLGLEMESMLREKGDNTLPFPPIVASGKNATAPHSIPSTKRITKGLLMLDFGACFKGYCSDITRVFSVGKAGKKQQQLYANVFAAKQFSQSQIKTGVIMGEVFDKAAGFLKKETGFPLIHGLGHGLGLDTHDFPSGFLSGNKEKLQKDMVLTVEPGIYGKFGGIRLEDDVVVTKKGCRSLTNAPAELLLL